MEQRCRRRGSQRPAPSNTKLVYYEGIAGGVREVADAYFSIYCVVFTITLGFYYVRWNFQSPDEERTVH